MPLDKSGKFHLNDQRAAHADKMGATKPAAAPAEKKPAAEHGSSAHTTLHDHGDGTYHTEGHDGDKQQHPHIGHALMHMAGKHAEGRHVHVHHDGGSMVSHHHDGGDVQGPHEHGSADEAGQHVASVMDDGDGDEQPQEGESSPMHGDGEGLTGLGF